MKGEHRFSGTSREIALAEAVDRSEQLGRSPGERALWAGVAFAILTAPR